MIRTKSLTESFADADWSAIAQAIKKTAVEIDGDSAETRRLRTKSGIIRLLLYKKICHFNGDSIIDLSFFVGTLKSIRSLEQEYHSKEREKTNFLLLLNLLIHKLKKQKLRAKKSLAIFHELEKMKNVIENGKIV